MNATLEATTGTLRDELHRGTWREPMLGFIPMPLIVNLAMVVLVALIFWWLLRGSKTTEETPMSVLKRRYAAGEIDRKTFLQMKEDMAE